MLLNRFTFTREGRLLDAQVDALDDTYISRNEVSSLQSDHITRDKVTGGDLLKLTIAVGTYIWYGEFLESDDSLFGTVLL